MTTSNHAQDDGFDFIRKMWGNMGFNMPGMMTPTLDTEELERRITDLKAVEGWLKMNLNVLQMTIQGLEVQRATLMAVKAMGASVAAGAAAATTAAGGSDAPAAHNGGAQAPGASGSAEASQAANPFANPTFWTWPFTPPTAPANMNAQQGSSNQPPETPAEQPKPSRKTTPKS